RQLQDCFACAAQALKIDRDARRAGLAELQSQLTALQTGEPNDQAYRDARQDEQMHDHLYHEALARIQRVNLGMQLWSSPVQVIERPARASLAAYARLSDMPAVAFGLALIL